MWVEHQHVHTSRLLHSLEEGLGTLVFLCVVQPVILNLTDSTLPPVPEEHGVAHCAVYDAVS